MIRVITANNTFDFVKGSMVEHYIETGYVVALA